MKSRGWTVFILSCADNTYHVGMCRDMARKLMAIYSRTGYWFKHHQDRLPVKVSFSEGLLHFKEAYAKYLYAREMNRKLKDKLIKTRKWPNGGPWKEYKRTGKIVIPYLKENFKVMVRIPRIRRKS